MLATTTLGLPWAYQGFQWGGSGALRPSLAIQRSSSSAGNSMPSHSAYSRISEDPKEQRNTESERENGIREGAAHRAPARGSKRVNSQMPATLFPVILRAEQNLQTPRSCETRKAVRHVNTPNIGSSVPSHFAYTTMCEHPKTHSKRQGAFSSEMTYKGSIVVLCQTLLLLSCADSSVLSQSADAGQQRGGPWVTGATLMVGRRLVVHQW